MHDRALVLAVAGQTVADVERALAEGADLVDLGTAEPAFAAEVRARFPALVLAATPGDLPGLCAAGVDLLFTADPVPPGAVAVGEVFADTPPGADLLARLAEPSVLPRLMSLPGKDFGDDSLAVVALAAARGVRVFRVHEVRRVKQVVEMAASINGTRPPAAVIRALT